MCVVYALGWGDARTCVLGLVQSHVEIRAGSLLSYTLGTGSLSQPKTHLYSWASLSGRSWDPPFSLTRMLEFRGASVELLALNSSLLACTASPFTPEPLPQPRFIILLCFR